MSTLKIRLPFVEQGTQLFESEGIPQQGSPGLQEIRSHLRSIVQPTTDMLETGGSSSHVVFFTSRTTIINVKLNGFSIDPKMWVSVTMLSHHCILVLIQPSTPYINTLATVIRIDAMTFLLPGPTNSNNIHSRGPSRTPGTYHKPNTINLKINMTLFRIKICSSISLHYTLQLFQHCGPTTMHEEFPFRVLGEGIILFYDTGTVRKGQFLLWFHSLQ